MKEILILLSLRQCSAVKHREAIVNCVMLISSLRRIFQEIITLNTCVCMKWYFRSAHITYTNITSLNVSCITIMINVMINIMKWFKIVSSKVGNNIYMSHIRTHYIRIYSRKRPNYHLHHKLKSLQYCIVLNKYTITCIIIGNVNTVYDDNNKIK